MTKIKKISKIIPAVLLSGAMVVPVSQLTSPVIAHAYENSAYTQKAIDYTPTITKLVDAELNSPQSRSVQRTNNNDVVVPTNGEIKVNLEGKDYHEFNAKLAVPREDNSSIRYKVFLDDRQIRDISMKPGEEKELHVELFGDDAKELKIVATNSSNARANNPGLVENGTFTTYYTDYTDEMNIKKEKIIRTPYKRACSGYAYIGTRDPFSPIYLTTNKKVKFPTVSDDPLKTNRPYIPGQLYIAPFEPTLYSKTGVNREVYSGSGCCSVTVGVNVQYEVKTAMRARQYYDSKGNIFRASTDTYTTYTPVNGSDMYASVKIKDL